VKQPLTIWILGDGKPGHENQSLGLAEAIARRTECEIHGISSRPLRHALASARKLPKPDLIIAAGHSTHVLLCWFSRHYRAKSIVLMRPSLPSALFDMVIAPQHDFAIAPPASDRLLLTRGAINRVRPAANAVRGGALVLLGGPSKQHGWDSDQMRGMLSKIAARTPNLEVADSRRTPGEFFDSLDFIPVRHSHCETPQGWLAERLATAAEVWVTEDSVSMVYEALTGGARVGILPVPRIRDGARVIRGLDQLVKSGRITRFEAWEKCPQLHAHPEPLAEADRAADWVLAGTHGEPDSPNVRQMHSAPKPSTFADE